MRSERVGVHIMVMLQWMHLHWAIYMANAKRDRNGKQEFKGRLALNDKPSTVGTTRVPASSSYCRVLFDYNSGKIEKIREKKRKKER